MPTPDKLRHSAEGILAGRDVSGGRRSVYEREPEAQRRQVTTFYSFKGGVGRTQALCAVGHLLRQHRRRALLVDVDLEAPGLSLSLLGVEELRSKLGFLEIVSDLGRLLVNAIEQDIEVPDDLSGALADQISKNLHVIPPTGDAGEPELITRIKKDFPQLPVPDRQGSLCLLSCGRIYDDYTGGTARLGLQRLLTTELSTDDAKAERLIQAAGFGAKEQRPENVLHVLVRVLHDALLKCRLPGIEGEAEPEYVLVDSRAGLADIGGVCVRGLADHLVVLSGLNRQNLAGTRMALDHLTPERREKRRLTVVLSPVPEAEIELLNKRVNEARRVLLLDSDPYLLHYHKVLFSENQNKLFP